MKHYNKITSCYPAGSGHYKVTIEYRNKPYSGLINCMPWIDLYKSKERGWKTIAERIYKEVKRQNNLIK